ncbi:MAG: S-layer homology domain-containing protein [Cyanobacteria bacterium J06597_1]
MRCHRPPALAPWYFSLLALLILLASCQGTPFGTALEEAVAPAVPQQPDRPNPETPLDSEDLASPEDGTNSGEFVTPEDCVNPDDCVNPGDLPDLEDRLTPDNGDLGATTPDSNDPEFPIDPEDPSSESSIDADSGSIAPDDGSPDATRQSRFRDLDVDTQTANAIAALDELDVFADIDTEEFQPNRSVRRQEFARWAMLAYNELYADEPERQLPLADDSETPLFLDVPEDLPEFPHIQALGNAGIVDMRSDREFEPDNLLSRANLIAIKVALDLGADNVQGTLADVERDWAFTDASDIRAGDIPAIASDFTLGDASNIRRAFGPLEDFEPQAPVTRAQVAVALAEFGVGGDRRAAISVGEPSSGSLDTAPSQSTPGQSAPSQPEDDDRPLSSKNPPSDSPSDTETPEDSEPPNRETPLENSGDRRDREPLSPENSEGGGRFLDL